MKRTTLVIPQTPWLSRFGNCACGRPAACAVNDQPCCVDCLEGRLRKIAALVRPVKRSQGVL